MESNYQSKLIAAVVKSMTGDDQTRDEERDKLIADQFDLIRRQRTLIEEQEKQISSLMAELESFRRERH